ncbi:MAG: type 1 glutamine amidotransferase [Ectothiorhodospiraceae bacterium]|nr:type 1 glutamine amidotransferase [Ectothiorhodospiraceae bacterium]MCH8503222.1 type 1 glutamine amidotransferase [Ectothiorhodospiraceae bacterium]
MRAHYLQHVPFEGLGSIEPWLAAAGYEISCSRLFESPELPPLDAPDFLVVMGGPMSVNDEREHAWLAAEKRFIRHVIASGRPVLGICLGAQLIASALGARVTPNSEPEIGWFPVQGTMASEDMFRFPEEMAAFHWHGETFELPPGAVRLARSEACENQAFQLGSNVIGLQFHLETTPASARDIVLHCGDELCQAPFVQSRSDILSAPMASYEAINAVMADLLWYLHRQRTG